MTRLIRFRFSLATLLIAMAWSGVAVWVNVTPRLVQCKKYVDFLQLPNDDRLWCGFAYGWPKEFYRTYTALEPSRIRGPAFEPGLYASLPWNAAAGVLLVAMLTWGSSQLLRRVASRLQRGRA